LRHDCTAWDPLSLHTGPATIHDPPNQQGGSQPRRVSLAIIWRGMTQRGPNRRTSLPWNGGRHFATRSNYAIGTRKCYRLGHRCSALQVLAAVGGAAAATATVHQAKLRCERDGHGGFTSFMIPPSASDLSIGPHRPDGSFRVMWLYMVCFAQALSNQGCMFFSLCRLFSCCDVLVCLFFVVVQPAGIHFGHAQHTPCIYSVPRPALKYQRSWPGLVNVRSLGA
jgi:hypothetical protein